MPTTCHGPAADSNRGVSDRRCELLVTVEEIGGRPVPEALARLLRVGDVAYTSAAARSGSEWGGGRRVR